MGTFRRFNRLLDASFQPPRTWQLNTALSFDSDDVNEGDAAALKAVGTRINSKMKITVPKGFKTDLASVPRACWAFIAPFDIARAGVVHDYIYWCIRQYRSKNPDADPEVYNSAKAVADKVFLEAMKSSEPKVPSWKIWAAHKAVVLFGASSIVPRDEL